MGLTKSKQNWTALNCSSYHIDMHICLFLYVFLLLNVSSRRVGTLFCFIAVMASTQNNVLYLVNSQIFVNW